MHFHPRFFCCRAPSSEPSNRAALWSLEAWGTGGGMYIFSLHSFSRHFFIKFTLKVLSSYKKRGGQEWYQSICIAFLHICRWILRLLSCLNLKKTGYRVLGPKKVETFFMWSALPKAQRRVKQLRYFC